MTRFDRPPGHQAADRVVLWAGPQPAPTPVVFGLPLDRPARMGPRRARGARSFLAGDGLKPLAGPHVVLGQSEPGMREMIRSRTQVSKRMT